MHLCPDELGPILAFWHHIPDLARLLWYKARQLPASLQLLTVAVLAALLFTHAGCSSDTTVVIDDKQVHVKIDTDRQDVDFTLARCEPLLQVNPTWNTTPTAATPQFYLIPIPLIIPYVPKPVTAEKPE